MANTIMIDVRSNDKTNFDGIKSSLEKSLGGLAGIAKVAGADLASSLVGPLVAATGTAVAAFASAGAALGAFGAAVAPQLSAAKSATDLYTKAQQSAAIGSATAAKDMEKYKATLAALPPATRATAIAFVGLKNDFQKWSDALAPKTMPIFTKGIQIMRQLLPALTPLVNVAADALSKFMGTLQKDVQGGGVQKFIGKLADAARTVLPAFLNSIKNVVVGIGGLIGAFLPLSGNFAQGLEKMTAKFAEFGKSLGSNPAFQNWLNDMQSRGPGILTLLGNLAKSFITIATALTPFSGLTLLVAEAFAKFVAAIPQSVMNWLAPTIAGIVIGIKAWAVVQGILNIALLANPLGLVIVAIAGFAAAMVLAYNKSDTFRRIVDTAWAGTKEAISTAWGVIRPILSKFAGWFTDAKKPLSEFSGFIKSELLGIIKDAASGISGIGDSISKLPDSIDALKGLGDKGKGAKEGGNKALSAISKPFAKIASIIKDIMGGLFDWIGSHWDDALNGIAKAVGTWGKAMQKLWAKPWNWIIDFASMFWALLTAGAIGGLKRVVHAILSPWPGIQKAWDNHMNGLATAAAHMVVRVIQAIGRLPGRIASIASTMWNSIPRSLNGVASSIQGILNNLGSWVSGKLSSIKSSISSAISGIVGMIPGFAHGGIVGGAAGGGPRSGMQWVGEQGPELVSLPTGSTVHSTGDSKRIAGGGGGNSITSAIAQMNKGGGNVAALALKQLIDAIDDKISTIRSKFNAVISIIKQKFDGNQEDALVAYAKKNLAALEVLAKKRDAVAAKLADSRQFAQGLTSQLMGSAGISGLAGLTGVGIKTNLQGSLNKLRSFAAALKALAKRGLSHALFQQIAEAGPDGGLELAQSFLAMDPGTFKQANAIQSQIGKVAGQIGSFAGQTIFGTASLEKLENSIQKAMDKAADKFADKISKALGKHAKRASGGIAGGMTWVGEGGPELLDLPYGSNVYSAGQSRAMAANSGGSMAPIQVNLNVDGKTLASVMFDPFKQQVRQVAGRGSNSVQLALS